MDVLGVSLPLLCHIKAHPLRATEERVTAFLSGGPLVRGAENNRGDRNRALNAEIWGWGEVGGGSCLVQE